jgi:hypothetical protein
VTCINVEISLVAVDFGTSVNFPPVGDDRCQGLGLAFWNKVDFGKEHYVSPRNFCKALKFSNKKSQHVAQ